MVDDFSAYMTIMAIALVTLVTRLLGPRIMRFVTDTPQIRIFLDSMSSSVIVAIVATALMRGGYREAAAVACAGAVMAVSRNTVLAMTVGMASAALWVQVAGS